MMVELKDAFWWDNFAFTYAPSVSVDDDDYTPKYFSLKAADISGELKLNHRSANTPFQVRRIA